MRTSRRVPTAVTAITAGAAFGTAAFFWARSLGRPRHACVQQEAGESNRPATPIGDGGSSLNVQSPGSDDPTPPDDTNPQNSTLLGLAPLAVVVALVFGALVDSGVFAAVAAAGGFEVLLWSILRLFGFYIVAVASYYLLNRYTDRRQTAAVDRPNRRWYWRSSHHPGSLASIAALPLLLATPVPWLIVNLACWSIFLIMQTLGIQRAPLVRLATYMLALISAVTIASFILPAGSIPRDANPSRLLVGRVLAGFPRAVIFTSKGVSDGGANTIERQVGYILSVDDQGLTLLESYPPRVWVVNTGSVVGRVPCTYADEPWKRSIIERIREGNKNGVTTLPCNTVKDDAAERPAG